MSDPPKKLGSLKDRIAAFENKGSVPAPAAAPVPRPKPASAASWKLKPPSPPDSPRASADNGDRRGGMSAADAKESIGRGGSLKDRMAALQGRGGFGMPSPPPVAPKPAVERPKWKPPPVVSPPEDDEDAEHEGDNATPTPHPVSPPTQVDEQDDAPKPHESEGGEQEESAAPAEESEGEKEVDPAEEERQRRAAIAARMARLGGARVGMAAPPLFGKKPDIKRGDSAKPKEEEAPKVVTSPETSQDDDKQVDQETPSQVISPPTSKPDDVESANTPAQTEETSPGYFDAKPAAPSTSLSTDSAGTGGKSPSMPVPAGPRRAAPPRKKAAKSPSPAPQQVLDDQFTQSPANTPLLGDNVQAQEAIEAAQESREIEELGSRSPELVGSEETEALVSSLRRKDADEPAQQLAEPPHDTVEGEPAAPSVDDSSEAVVEPQIVTTTSETEHAEEPSEAPKSEEPPAEEDEEDESSRRKRIAERLAKSGGFNPFSGLPPKQPSLPPTPQATQGEEPAVPSPPPSAPARRESFRQATSDAMDHPDPPVRRSSVRSTIDEPLRSPPPMPTSPKPETPARKGSTASIGSNVSVPSRKMSQDDHKSILETVHPHPHHQHQRSISEDIVEEPESEVVDEPVNAESEDAAAARGTHEDPRSSEHLARNNLSFEASQARRVSYLQVEEEESVNVEYHEEEEYEPPASEDPSSPVSNYGEEEAGALAEEPEPDVQAEDPEPEPEPVPPRRPSLPPPTKRTSIPPPPRAVPTTPDIVGDADVARRASVSKRSIPPPPVVPPSAEDVDDDDDGPESSDNVPPGTATLKSPPPPVTGPISPPPPVPPLPPTFTRPTAAGGSRDEQSSSEVAAPRTPPVRKDSVRKTSSGGPPPRPPAFTRPSIPVPPPPSNDDYAEPPAPQKTTALPSRRESLATSPAPPKGAPPGLPITDEPEESDEQEVLPEDDGDPIDPSFHSPARQSMQGPFPPVPFTPTPPAPPPQSPAVPRTQAEEEEEGQARRQTIAERMAKLGGVRFGAPMPMPSRPAPPAVKPEETEEESKEVQPQSEAEETPEEEDEFARRQRIAARIAGMGGMRLGMIPGVMSPPPSIPSPTSSSVPAVRREDDGAGVARPPPLAPKVPPPQTLQATHAEESESESVGQSQSDDGVHVEAGESELEEVSHEDAEEEAPPPVPSRQARQSSVPQPQAPPMPPAFGRPPVPLGRPSFPSPAARGSQSPARGRRSTTDDEGPSASTYIVPPQPAVGPSSPNDYVMVEPESATEERPPPPPSRPSRAPPPPRNVPPPPPPADLSESVGQSWELPQIPSSTLDFGGETDLPESGQWSDVPAEQPPPPPPHDPSAPLEPARRRSSQLVAGGPHAELNLSADELMAHWGRVGVQIHEVAATLFDKSKKTVVGDGTYTGFIQAVISQVPNASFTLPLASYDSLGYLIYSQAGSSLQRRASDIMPGDIIVLHEAKLKGHKGLQMYHQNVGVGDPVVAIVADFEVKRSKVKVFQANHHIGQQSVEFVSYRLEDVKSGTIKIYRVLEK